MEIEELIKFIESEISKCEIEIKYSMDDKKEAWFLSQCGKFTGYHKILDYINSKVN